MTVAVFGPTCAGKSTFIRDHLHTPAKNIVYAHELGKRQMNVGHTIHYNTLIGALPESDDTATSPAFVIDLPRLVALLDQTRPDRCYVLICPRDELITRATARSVVEQGSPHLYPSRHWVDILKRADLSGCYQLLLSILDSCGLVWTTRNTGRGDAP